MSWLKTIYGQIRRSSQPKRKNKMKKVLQKKLFEKVGNELKSNNFHLVDSSSKWMIYHRKNDRSGRMAWRDSAHGVASIT
jgi:hypothetical protein